MLLRLERVAQRRASSPQRRYSTLACSSGADRHVVERHVGDDRERVLQRLVEPPCPPPRALGRNVLQRRDLGHQPRRRRLVLLPPWPCRSPSTRRSGAPAPPRSLTMCARRASSSAISRRPRPWPRSRAARFAKRPLQRLGVLADPFDVEHDGVTRHGLSCPQSGHPVNTDASERIRRWLLGPRFAGMTGWRHLIAREAPRWKRPALRPAFRPRRRRRPRRAAASSAARRFSTMRTDKIEAS